MPPARTPIETPGVAVVARALTQAWAAPARIVPSIGGTLPQYVFQDVLKVPSLLVPYANLDQANHAPNENLRIDYFIRGLKSFISGMERLGHHHAA
jgi:acetylornithine deacetylase/succinyl-diaminopimelate desuccinylase-like protein